MPTRSVRRLHTQWTPITAAAALTDPNTITGLVAWYDASDAATITSSGSPARVSQWNNKKTSATTHLVQGTGSSQPTTGTRTQNSLNVLDFNNSPGNNMTVSLTNTSDNQTLFGVLLSDVDTSGNLGWCSLRSGGNDYDNAGAWVCHGASGGDFQTYNNSTTRYVAAATNTNATQLSALYVSGGECTIYIDGAATGSSSANGVAGLNTDGLIVGDRWLGGSPGGFGWDGWIAEIIYYDSVLGAADRQSVEAFLRNKWNTP